VSDDVIQRLFDKIDDLRDRLARVETALEEREKNQVSVKSIAAWLITTGIAVYAAIKH